MGHVTSGAFGPSLGTPMAMAMLDASLGAPGTALVAELRGRAVGVRVAALPFVAAGFKRSSARTAP